MLQAGEVCIPGSFNRYLPYEPLVRVLIPFFLKNRGKSRVLRAVKTRPSTYASRIEPFFTAFFRERTMNRVATRSDYASRDFFKNRLMKSLQQGDKHFKKIKRNVKVKFKHQFDEFVHQAAYAIRHHVVYRSDGGRIARGLVRATGDLGRIHRYYMETRVANNAPMLLDFLFWRRRNKAPGQRWVMNLHIAPSEFHVMKGVTIEVDEDKTAKERMRSLIDRAGMSTTKIRGQLGKRIWKLVDLMEEVDYPRVLDLWVYNPLSVKQFMDFHTTENDRRDMTRGTNGRMPFDGHSGGHGQWRSYPFKQLAQFYTKNWTWDQINRKLVGIDKLILDSREPIIDAKSRTSIGGGSSHGDRVQAFVAHVEALERSGKHLYSTFR